MFEAPYTSDAPALLVPGLFDPAFCRALVGLWAKEVRASGIWVEGREYAGPGAERTVKLRHDCDVRDPAWVGEIERRISVRLRRGMLEVFGYDPRFHESVRIGCYDARWFGWFKPHRDNATARDAYRKYTLVVSLNGGEYEGGELRFPEYSKGFRPPTGTALVFPCSALHEVRPLRRGRRFILVTRFMDEADYHDWVRRGHERPGAVRGRSRPATAAAL